MDEKAALVTGATTRTGDGTTTATTTTTDRRSDEVKKRLFDYKPFSSQESFSQQQHKSDFIFASLHHHQHPRQAILVRETAATNQTKNSNVVGSGDVTNKKNPGEDNNYDEYDDYDYDYDEDDDDEDEEDEYDEDEDEDIDSEYDKDENDEYIDEEDEDRGGVENRSTLSVETDRQSLPVGADEEHMRLKNSGGGGGGGSSVAGATAALTSNSSAGGGAGARQSSSFAMITPIQSRLFSFVKRVGSTIESNQKIQNVKGYISDKSSQIKEVKIANLFDLPTKKKKKLLFNFVFKIFLLECPTRVILFEFVY